MGTEMSTQWYYAADGVQYGPVSSQELKRLADSKILLPGHLLWKNDFKNWVNAGNVNGLFTIRVNLSPLMPQIPPLRGKAIQIKLEAEGKNDKDLSASLPEQPKKLSLDIFSNPVIGDIPNKKCPSTPPSTPATGGSKTIRFILAAVYYVVGGFLLLFIIHYIALMISPRGLKQGGFLVQMAVNLGIPFFLKYIRKKYWLSR
jgi:hypothetical protein